MSQNSAAVDTPMPYRVQAHTLGGGQSVAAAGSTDIVFDSAWPPSQPPGLPGPADLLAAAFAACLLKNVERSAHLMPFSYVRAQVDVAAYRQDSPPRFTRLHYQLRIVTAESARRVELLHENLRRHGTVYNTLAAACEIEGTAVAIPPG